VKGKRIVRRPWGRKKNGGWIIQPDELLKHLKGGEIAEFGDLHVGATQLSKLIALMRFPEHEVLITSNGKLEVQTIRRIMQTRNGQRRTGFRKSRLEHSFRVENGAWVTNTSRPRTTLVIKPRKYA
jgi:hypothetical protein